MIYVQRFWNSDSLPFPDKRNFCNLRKFKYYETNMTMYLIFMTNIQIM